jgi:streptogramin lyase
MYSKANNQESHLTFAKRVKRQLSGLGLGLVAALGLMSNTATAQSPDVEYNSQWTGTNGVNGPFQPYGIALNNSGHVYVSEAFNNRVSKFDTQGNLILSWGSAASGPGQFSSAFGISTDSSGNVYMADAWQNQILKFDGNGNHLMSFGGGGSGPGQFSQPEAVVVDDLGQIYVQDTYNNRIQKFSSTGSYLLEWGTYGNDTNQFMYPRGLAVDANRNVYVADSSNRIKKFNEYGGFLTEWNVSTNYIWVNGLAVDTAGKVYATDVMYHRILKFDSNGNELYALGASGSGNGQFNGPANVAVAADGSLYVAESSNYRVQKFTKIKTLLYTLRQPLTMSIKLNTQSESNGFPAIVQTTYSLTSALNDLKTALGVTSFGSGAKLYTHQRFFDNNTTENQIVIRNTAGAEWNVGAHIQVTEKTPLVIGISPTSTSGTIKHNYLLQMNLGGMVLQTEGLGTTTWTAEDTNSVSGMTIALSKLSLAPRGNATISGTNAVVEGTFGWNAPTLVIVP